MEKKNILICLDRDGTIVYDDKYYLGRQKNWKDLIKFLPGVVEGIKILRKIPNVHLYIITNQPAVAVKDFPLLTEERAREVTQEIILRLKEKGAKIDGYALCSHSSREYVNKYPDREFDESMVHECSCMKPNTGMIKTAMKNENLLASETKVYVVGDRMTDVHTAHNANGFGIFVPSTHKDSINQAEQLKEKKHKNTYLAKDFLDAANFIYDRERN